MLAAIQTGVRTVEVRDIPEPQADTDHALIRVRAAGVCGSDLHQYHAITEPDTLPSGHEVAGEVIARHPHQAALAKALGADSVLPDDPTSAIEQVRTLTGGLGADFVAETVGGHSDTMNLAWELARVQGTIAVLGVFPEPVTVDLQ